MTLKLLAINDLITGIDLEACPSPQFNTPYNTVGFKYNLLG